ncbi:MAG: hypothetical protein IJV67_01425 [Clostridia bacterium]|nr:hypothetical protein [Clostridia bacterium]
MRKMIKKLLCLTMVLLLALSLCACGGGGGNSTSTGGGNSTSTGGSSGGGSVIIKPTNPTTKVDYKTYQSYWMKQHDYKTMPVAAFNGAANAEFYPKTMITDEHFKEMADCYINTSFALYDKVHYVEDVKKTLEYCAKYGISYMAGGFSFGSSNSANVLEAEIYKALLDPANNTNALGGVMIRDEPSMLDFQTIRTSMDTFKEVFGKNKNYLYHANLFPTYANTTQLYGNSEANPVPEEGYTYEQYVDDYLEIYDPQILSYDYYPLRSNGTMSDGYFENMSIIRRKAMGKEIPFWVYIQTCKYSGGVRVPSEADIHWQVNTALAYGCKGIQYFTYVIPSRMDTGTWEAAMIGHDGKPTDIYYYAQKVNKYIADVDEVLMCSLSKGIMKAGATPATIPAEDVITGYGKLASVDGESVLVGCFDYKGKDAYYVVNNDVYVDCDITLNFTEACDGYAHAYEGKTEFNGKNSLQMTLKPGTATLVVIG